MKVDVSATVPDVSSGSVVTRRVEATLLPRIYLKPTVTRFPGIFVYETQRDFVEMIRQAIEGAREVEKPLRRWAEAGKGRTERAYYTHRLLETASAVIKVWQKRFDWIRTCSDELLYVHGVKGSSKRQTYINRKEKCLSSADETSRLLKPMEMDDIMEGVQELGDRLKDEWRRDGRLSAEDMIRKKGPNWGTRA